MAAAERFAVATEQVSSGGDRLSAIAGELSGASGWRVQTAAAAAATAAPDTCAALAGRRTGALAHMGDCSDRLAAAVRKRREVRQRADGDDGGALLDARFEKGPAGKPASLAAPPGGVGQ